MKTKKDQLAILANDKSVTIEELWVKFKYLADAEERDGNEILTGGYGIVCNGVSRIQKELLEFIREELKKDE